MLGPPSRQFSRGTWRVALFSLWLGLTAGERLAAAGVAGGSDGAAVELQVKASLLPKLAAFVAWPTNVFSDPSRPIRLGVLGSHPFRSQLERAVIGQTADGRPLQVLRVTDAASAAACHLVFISPSERAQALQLLRALKGKPVLTVGDWEDFARDGGVVNLVKIDGRVRFQVNLDAAQENGLTISAKLLQVSQVIRTRQTARTR
jgi:hypothetical protein